MKTATPVFQSVLTSAALLVILSFSASKLAQAQSTITCPSGMYDMVDWMTLDSDLASVYHLEGTSNPLYTVRESDKFYWVKGGLGYPWDIQLYDSDYVYLWITELSWTVPQSYKKFTYNKNLPLVPRCAIADNPGSTIKVANTSYDLHTNCAQSCSVTLGLQNAINQVYGPYYRSFGGNLPGNLKTLMISYRYNCDDKLSEMSRQGRVLPDSALRSRAVGALRASQRKLRATAEDDFQQAGTWGRHAGFSLLLESSGAGYSSSWMGHPATHFQAFRYCYSTHRTECQRGPSNPCHRSSCTGGTLEDYWEDPD